MNALPQMPDPMGTPIGWDPIHGADIDFLSLQSLSTYEGVCQPTRGVRK